MHDLLRMTAERAARYLDDRNTRRVTPAPDALARLAELGGPLPDAPTDPDEVVALLDRVGSPATVASPGGRYFGFVVGGTARLACGSPPRPDGRTWSVALPAPTHGRPTRISG